MKQGKYLFWCFLFLLSCQQLPKKPPIIHSKYFANDIVFNKTAVIYFLNTECPICQKYQGSLKTIFTKFNDKFNFYYVFSGPITEKNILDFCDYDSIPYKNVIMDLQGFYAKSFGAKVTPQVIILSKDFKQLYSGKIDDRFESLGSFKPNASINYIENALISLLNHETIEISETEPVGCFIEHD